MGTFEWANKKLRTSDYDTKVLEIILPDVIIIEDSLKVLNDFKETMGKSGLEVWYCIGK